MAAPTIIEHKRGDTFSYAAFLPEGALYEGGSWIAKCQANEKLSGVKHPLIAVLIEPVAPETRYLLNLFAPASDVEAWAVGKLLADVEFIDTAAEPEPYKASSATFTIALKKDETK